MAQQKNEAKEDSGILINSPPPANLINPRSISPVLEPHDAQVVALRSGRGPWSISWPSTHGGISPALVFSKPITSRLSEFPRPPSSG
jgi:hypothetical protein